LCGEFRRNGYKIHPAVKEGKHRFFRLLIGTDTGNVLDLGRSIISNDGSNRMVLLPKGNNFACLPMSPFGWLCWLPECRGLPCQLLLCHHGCRQTIATAGMLSVSAPAIERTARKAQAQAERKLCSRFTSRRGPRVWSERVSRRSSLRLARWLWDRGRDLRRPWWCWYSDKLAQSIFLIV